MPASHGLRLRRALEAGRAPLAFIGVYDAFSASLAARHYPGLFLSGYGLAASRYGLPDVGFNAWPDLVDWTRRVRSLCPAHHLLVDVDDGFGDSDIAAHVVREIERAGASGVILEDQRRPRRCGHVAGKQVLALGEFLHKLERVLEAREDLVVVARTDAATDGEREQRALAFQKAGADAVLADGIEDLDILRRLAEKLDEPLAFNQMGGGKSPACSLSELGALGVRIVNYSTPALFAAGRAIEDALVRLALEDGRLPTGADSLDLASCNAVLEENRRGVKLES